MSLFQARVNGFFLLAVVLVGVLFFSTQVQARGGGGMGKSIFVGEPSEDQCRLCHGDGETLPHPILQVTNSDRHHSRIGKPIEGLGDGRYDTIAPGDISSGEYQCMTCHGAHNTDKPFLKRDCLACHPVSSVTGNPHWGENVHHSTQTFRERKCYACHNFLSSQDSDDNSQGRGWGMRGMRGR